MEIKIYTTPTCGWCDELKGWLKKRKHPYVEYDVSESQSDRARTEMIEKSGQMAVPVIDVNGTILVGFHEKEIEKAISQAS